MGSEPEQPVLRDPWTESAERLLERVPGVVSAAIEGTKQWVSAVRVWYEPTWPVAQVMAAVDECLVQEGARLAATRFHAVIAEPDRRATRRAPPERAPTPSDATGVSPDVLLKLVGHKFEQVQPDVVGAHVWIDCGGRLFSGAALGPAVPPASLRTPALATLRALHACLQILYEGPIHPGLVLETVVRMDLEGQPVVIVGLTGSENARPTSLTSAWVDTGDSGLAVILATLSAAARTVTRWLAAGRRERDSAPTTAGMQDSRAAPWAEKRLVLVDYEVDERPTGDLGVGVRLAGFGGSVDRRANGRGDEATQMRLGASATLDAVQELLNRGGWNEGNGGDLKQGGTYRLRVGEHEVVVVRAEATVDGRSIPLVGATSAEGGLERAAIRAMLQATNPLVAGCSPPSGPEKNEVPPSQAGREAVRDRTGGQAEPRTPGP